MLNKFKSVFSKSKEAEVKETPSFNVEDVMTEIIANQEIVEEVSFMESLAFDTMALLKETPILFNRVMKAKPEKAYEEAVNAVNYLISLSHVNEKVNRGKAKAIMEDFKKLEGKIKTLDKVKAIFSALLYEAGTLIINTGLFVMDTTGILTIYALRILGHIGTETIWACKEIGKSFNHRMIKPYQTK